MKSAVPEMGSHEVKVERENVFNFVQKTVMPDLIEGLAEGVLLVSLHLVEE